MWPSLVTEAGSPWPWLQRIWYYLLCPMNTAQKQWDCLGPPWIPVFNIFPSLFSPLSKMVSESWDYTKHLSSGYGGTAELMNPPQLWLPAQDLNKIHLSTFWQSRAGTQSPASNWGAKDSFWLLGEREIYLKVWTLAYQPYSSERINNHDYMESISY